MSNKKTISEEAFTKALDPKLSVTEAVAILTEAAEFKSGQKVAILDGTPYALDGVQGTVKGPSGNNSGFLDVELPNKMVVPVPANLLLAV